MVGLYYNVQQSSAMLCWLSLQCRVHRLVPGYRTSNLLGHCSYQPNEISKKDIKVLRFNVCSPQKRKFRFLPNFFYISCCWVLALKKMTCYSLWPAAGDWSLDQSRLLPAPIHQPGRSSSLATGETTVDTCFRYTGIKWEKNIDSVFSSQDGEVDAALVSGSLCQWP